MIIKTRAWLTEAVLGETKRLHPYELPALIVLPTEGGSDEYCGWILEPNKRPRAPMSEQRFVLAIDQGTTSSRAIAVRRRMGDRRRGAGGVPAASIPQPGWVEHDPEEIWSTRARDLPRRASSEAGLEAADIAAIGITNQRETTLVWDRATGKPLAQRHRLAGPPHRAALRRAARGRPRARMSPRRPGCCSTPISPAPSSPGCSTTSPGARERARARRALLRHRRQLPDLAG